MSRGIGLPSQSTLAETFTTAVYPQCLTVTTAKVGVSYMNKTQHQIINRKLSEL